MHCWKSLHHHWGVWIWRSGWGLEHRKSGQKVASISWKTDREMLNCWPAFDYRCFGKIANLFHPQFCWYLSKYLLTVEIDLSQSCQQITQTLGRLSEITHPYCSSAQLRRRNVSPMAPLKDRPTKAETQTWHPVNCIPFFLHCQCTTVTRRRLSIKRANEFTWKAKQVPDTKPTTLTANVKCKYLVTVLNHYFSKWYSCFLGFFLQTERNFFVSLKLNEKGPRNETDKWRTIDNTFDASHCAQCLTF